MNASPAMSTQGFLTVTTIPFNGTDLADEGTGVHVESCRDHGCFGCEELTAQRFHDFFNNS